LKLKLNIWLTLCLFVFSTIFILVVFNITYSSLEEELVLRAKDKLNAVNILKRRLIELHLRDKKQEADHILSNADLHGVNEADLVENLQSISEIKRIEVLHEFDPNQVRFVASLDSDSTYYNFLFTSEKRQVRLVFGLQDIQDILLERTGLGVTGESYVVNERHRLMSASLFHPQEYPTNISSPSHGVLSAIGGKEDVTIYTDYRDVGVMGAFRPVDFYGIKMALLTEIDLDELMRPIYSIREKMVIVVGILMAVSLAISVFLGKILSNPIVQLRRVADQLSLGTLPSDIRPSGPVLEMQQITQSMDKLIHSLKQIASFASDIGEGKMESTYVMLSRHDELGKAILQMRDQLVTLNNEKNALELNSKRVLIEAQEKDRERISRDLHDGLGALLTTLKLRMEKSGLLVENADMRDLIERTISETRSLARNLMPAVLRDFGLSEALEQLISDIEDSTQIKVLFFNELENSNYRLEKDKQVYIYRVVQEAINNAIKHAQCDEIQLSITVFDDHLALYIKDNGIGFEVGQKDGFTGLGLRNIEERIRLMGGVFYIESGKAGTGIEIEIPIS
tara:strand:- start:42429 stop:44129 length:1701 start_codon:yes stop_codon:yes gene_type:complete